MKSINKTRGLLYKIARLLGDINSIFRCFETGSPKPVAKRFGSKIAGRTYGKTVQKYINRL